MGPLKKDIFIFMLAGKDSYNGLLQRAQREP